MRTGFMIYGANGYTGNRIAREAAARGLAPLLAGRDRDAVAALGAELGLEWAAFSLDDSVALDAALSRVACVLHCAGPFSRTAAPMIGAALRTRTHYLDITGEIGVLEGCFRRDAEASAAGILLLPGSGFDVVPSDCLAARVAARLPGASALHIAIRNVGDFSRGTLKTATQQLSGGTWVRRGGALRELPRAARGSTDFGDGAQPTLGASWGDIATAWHSTGIPDVDVSFAKTPQTALFGWPRGVRRMLDFGPVKALIQAQVARAPIGPDETQDRGWRTVVVAEARDKSGRVARSRLTCGGPYWVTVQTALSIVAKVLAGDVPVGYRTPSRAFGAELIAEVPDTTIVDLA